MEEDIEEDLFDKLVKVEEYINSLLRKIGQLEKENEELKDWKSEQGCSIQEVYELFIPKSVIRDKIDFYKRYGKIKNSDEYVMSVEIDILEEILGDE